MGDHSQDLQFIIWAYVGVGVATLALIAWVAVQSAGVRRRLAALDAQGIRRRSAGPAA